MCFFCHIDKYGKGLGHNPDAPPHRAENCRDSRNEHSRYFHKQTSAKPVAARAASVAVAKTAPTRRAALPSIPSFAHVSPRADPAQRGCTYANAALAGGVDCVCVVPLEGGATTVGRKLHDSDPSKRIGTMIAANSGRPGGAVGARGGVVRSKVHSGHKTQEEDIVSNWLLTAAGTDGAAQDHLFCGTINERWGMVDIASYDPGTLQDVNYVDATEPTEYGDAWTVGETRLSPKVFNHSTGTYWYDTANAFPTTLVFSAGPNAGCAQLPTGSTARTLNREANENYDFFRECVKETIRTGLDAMVSEKCTIALVARISCGIYAGPEGSPHRRRINREFDCIVNELLDEEVVPGCKRGKYFDEVIIPVLA
jgi:hypothetical protein